MVKIINKTDHVIALFINEQWETIMPTGLCCKFREDKSDPIVKEGITFIPTRIKDISNLPKRELHTVIIVERDIAQYLWKTHCREDVCYLNAPIVRDDKYNSLAAMSLVCMNDVLIRYCL